MIEYIRDGAEIYRQSFATIRAEADLSRFPADVSQAVVRMIHASGQVDLVDDVAFTPGVVSAARAALRDGAPIFCDAQMVAAGITRKRLPAGNDVICTLGDPRVPVLASTIDNTRSAAALELWGAKLEGAVVAIGNAPTALFHLLNLIEAGAPRPAAIVGGPVGFIGAAESKEASSNTPAGSIISFSAADAAAARSPPRRQCDCERSRMSAGKLWGVGIGPGDPELVTVKAARVIGEADVVAFHSARHGKSISRGVAAPYMREGQIEEHLVYPVTTETVDHPGGYQARWTSSTKQLPNGWQFTSRPVEPSRCSPPAIRSSTAPTCTCTRDWPIASTPK